MSCGGSSPQLEERHFGRAVMVQAVVVVKSGTPVGERLVRMIDAGPGESRVQPLFSPSTNLEQTPFSHQRDLKNGNENERENVI
jgi:hypothetical protein